MNRILGWILGIVLAGHGVSVRRCARMAISIRCNRCAGGRSVGNGGDFGGTSAGRGHGIEPSDITQSQRNRRGASAARRGDGTQVTEKLRDSIRTTGAWLTLCGCGGACRAAIIAEGGGQGCRQQPIDRRVARGASSAGYGGSTTGRTGDKSALDFLNGAYKSGLDN